MTTLYGQPLDELGRIYNQNFIPPPEQLTPEQQAALQAQQMQPPQGMGQSVAMAGLGQPMPTMWDLYGRFQAEREGGR
jgi:hypothetical protein